MEREVRSEIMGTDVFVKILSDSRDESSLRRDLGDAFSLFRDLDWRFSRFRPDSELSRLNAASEMPVSPEMAELLSLSLFFHRATKGIFDPSILSDLESAGYASGFGTDTFGVPTEGKHIDLRPPFHTLSLDRVSHIVQKPVGLRLDLGGIAKGYAVDRVAGMLAERGNTDFLVDAGGDIRVSGGDRGRGYGFFAVDIDGSSSGDGDRAILALHDRAVATSGTGRRRWRIGDEVRHHLIDPRTGKSADTDLSSVTVVDASVVRAETFAKAICILGREEGSRLADRFDIPAFLVETDGDTVYTVGMQPYVYENR